MLVRVLNRNQKAIVDKFGGQRYVFEPGEPLNVPEEAAEHIFGWGLDEPARMKKMMRMGIANRPDGAKIWSKIEMRPAGVVAPTGAEREAG